MTRSTSPARSTSGCWFVLHHPVSAADKELKVALSFCMTHRPLELTLQEVDYLLCSSSLTDAELVDVLCAAARVPRFYDPMCAVLRCVLTHSVSRVDPSAGGSVALVAAADSDNMDLVERLLNDGRIDPAAGNCAALTAAVRADSLPLVERILADHRCGRTIASCDAVSVATRLRRTAVRDRLLADPRMTLGVDRSDTLTFAVRLRDASFVERLLADPRVDPSVLDRWSMPVLYYAAANNDVPTVQLLLANGRADPAARDSKALRAAVTRGHMEVTDILLRDGRADPGAGENFALRWAAKVNNVAMVDLLMRDRRVDPSWPDQGPLLAASCMRNGPAVRRLLEDGRVDPCGANNPFKWAAGFGRVDMVDIFLSQAAAPRPAGLGRPGHTMISHAAMSGALRTAARRGHARTVRRILQDPQCVVRRCSPSLVLQAVLGAALHKLYRGYARRRRWFAVVQHLLAEEGAQPGWRGNAALLASACSLPICEALLADPRVDPLARDEEGLDALRAFDAVHEQINDAFAEEERDYWDNYRSLNEHPQFREPRAQLLKEAAASDSMPEQDWSLLPATALRLAVDAAAAGSPDTAVRFDGAWAMQRAFNCPSFCREAASAAPQATSSHGGRAATAAAGGRESEAESGQPECFRARDDSAVGSDCGGSWAEDDSDSVLDSDGATADDAHVGDAAATGDWEYDGDQDSDDSVDHGTRDAMCEDFRAADTDAPAEDGSYDGRADDAGLEAAAAPDSWLEPEDEDAYSAGSDAAAERADFSYLLLSDKNPWYDSEQEDIAAEQLDVRCGVDDGSVLRGPAAGCYSHHDPRLLLEAPEVPEWRPHLEWHRWMLTDEAADAFRRRLVLQPAVLRARLRSRARHGATGDRSALKLLQAALPRPAGFPSPAVAAASEEGVGVDGRWVAPLAALAWRRRLPLISARARALSGADDETA